MSNPWTYAGMDQGTYSRLPWPAKRSILLRSRGVRINDTCSGCGHRLDVMAERTRRMALPDQLRRHPFGLLIQAFVEHQADDMAVRINYSHAVLSCGH